MVAEVTERAVASDPAALLIHVDQLRRQSARIALDDVGADAASQAMMSLIRPDVLKLDLSVIQNPDTPPAVSAIRAVQVEAIRTGAVILAEGIETSRHLAFARSIGATLGQGWLLGRPGPLPHDVEPQPLALPRIPVRPATGATPYDVAIEWARPSRVSRRTILELSHALEDRRVQAAEPTVLLGTFQHIGHFDEATRRRYADLATRTDLTACFAQGMPETPAPNVHGCAIEADDPLIGDWTVIVIGSNFAEGLFAREVDAAGGRTFDVIASVDRDLVLAAARPLLERMKPASRRRHQALRRGDLDQVT